MESFPSGHVATSFGAAVFLSLYLNARLKIFADYRANPLLMVLCLSPVVLAMLMAGAISIDMNLGNWEKGNSHHWYDILAGAVLGILVAILCYRNAYAAVVDYRWNHVPLEASSRAGGAGEGEEEGYGVRYGFPKFYKGGGVKSQV
ncbi:hypothetical protein TWF481_004760 [Arthrobotrys musiformis]|uniref:Phosphatidic acid phosphatase type 2/haloperoxidase domain-containing protein n=1 Tax=Arthrobotrys musiformis TaxID=47236 RepID=A0AAV9WMM3_9PEZI